MAEQIPAHFPILFSGILNDFTLGNSEDIISKFLSTYNFQNSSPHAYISGRYGKMEVLAMGSAKRHIATLP